MRQRDVAVVAIIALMLGPFMMVQARVEAQDAGLFGALPTQVDVPPELSAVDEGSRGASEIAAGFPDPSDAASQLARWGWQENAFRTFTASDQQSPGEITILEVSLHRFAEPAGAAAAMPYFSDGRAAMLRLESSGPRTLTGRVPGGAEITLYDQQGAVLIRITAIGSSPDETETLSDLLYLVRERLALQWQGNYTSPQFGYEVFWDGDRVIAEGETSQPSAYDELALRSSEDPAYFVVVGMPVALPSIRTPEQVTEQQQPIYASPQFGYDVWRGAIVHALYDYADVRASRYPGSSITFTVDWGAGATIRYTASDGTEWVEGIGVAPFVSGDGLAFFIAGKTKELDEQYRPDLFNSIEVDLAVAANSEPPTPAPWNIDSLPGSGTPPQSLAATLPTSFAGSFGTVILQETLRRPPVQGVPEGVLYQYGPPSATEPTVTVIVHDGGFHRFESGLLITPQEYVHDRANAVLHYWRRSALSMSDVSPDAPISFVLSSYASMAHSAHPDKFTLLWSPLGSGWAIEIEASNERDIEAFIEAWVSQAAGIN